MQLPKQSTEWYTRVGNYSHNREYLYSIMGISCRMLVWCSQYFSPGIQRDTILTPCSQFGNNHSCQLLCISHVRILLHHRQDDASRKNITEVLIGLVLMLWDNAWFVGLPTNPNPRVTPELLHLLRHAPHHDGLITWLHEIVAQGIGMVRVGIGCTW